MCIALQQMRQEAVEEKIYEVVNKMLAKGVLTYEDIADYSGCSIEQVNAIADGTYKLH